MQQTIQNHIFLSYSRKDTPIMQRIRDDLREYGLLVWTDENLEPGSTAWESAIARAIKTSGCIVVILSPDAEQSEWVGRELAYAETLNVRIFPILARGDERNAIPFRLISHQWIDARHNYPQAAQTLIGAVRLHVQGMPIAPQPSQRTLPRDVPAAPPTTTVEPLWSFKAEDEIRAGLLAYKNGIFFGSYDQHLYAIQSGDGKLVWKYAAEAGIATTPAVYETNNLIVFGAEDNHLHTLDMRNGRVAWKYLTSGRVRGSPLVAHDCVFFGSDDGFFYALRAGSGRLLWQYDIKHPVRTRPVATEDRVIFGGEDGFVLCLELSGVRKWAYRMRGTLASPALDPVSNIVFIGSNDNYMHAIDAGQGWSVWKFRTGGPVISSAALANGMLFFGCGDGTVHALNAQAGNEKWHFKTPRPIVSTPVIHQGHVYFGGTDGNFYCLAAETGKEQWRFRVGSPITSAPVVLGNCVYVAALNHHLYALPLTADRR